MKKFVAILAIFGALFLGAMDLQTASKSELMEIKGVGEKKADAIIEYRKRNRLQSPSRNGSVDFIEIKFTHKNRR